MEECGFEDKKLVLIFGGSLGARRINESVAELIKWHNGSGKFYHIHATGKSGYEGMLSSLSDIKLAPEVTMREYIDNMDVCMAAADLVISRAGAITLGELQACAKPSVLIPSPYVAENHQYHNAMTLVRHGAALCIEEKDLTGEALCAMFDELCADPQRLAQIGENASAMAIADANDRICNEILSLVK